MKPCTISKITPNICITAMVHIKSRSIFLRFIPLLSTKCNTFMSLHFQSSVLSVKSCGLFTVASWAETSLLFFFRRCVLKWRNWLSVKSIVNRSWDVWRLHHHNITLRSPEEEKCAATGVYTQTDILWCMQTRKPKTTESEQITFTWVLQPSS